MARQRRTAIASALRERILRGLASGALRDGARLPSTRELAADLQADPRVVADAYRVLAADGLLVIRPRSGIYVLAPTGHGGAQRTAGREWLAEVVAGGVQRGVPATALADLLRGAVSARPISAAVIAMTLDQAAGLARELRDDFGMDARGFLAEELRPGERLPRAVQRAQLLVGTEFTGAQVRRLAERLDKAQVVIDVRPDLLTPAWRLLLRQVTWVVIADPRFRAIVHHFIAEAEGAGNVRVLIAGRDDLSVIAPDAPTYVTEAARQRIGASRLPGRLVTPARTLSDASVHAVAEVLVALNAAPPRGR